jgi:Spy/CpxP family protein refolding chaperone
VITFSTATLLMNVAAALCQPQDNNGTGKEAVQLGNGMSLVTPSLLEIGQQTNFFLAVADRADLTAEQLSVLEEVLRDFHVHRLQKAADLDVAEAQLRRLLTRDEIDLDAVFKKVKEIEAIQSDLTMHNIESLLRAIGTLTHEQHLALATLVFEPGIGESNPDSRQH